MYDSTQASDFLLFFTLHASMLAVHTQQNRYQQDGEDGYGEHEKCSFVEKETPIETEFCWHISVTCTASRFE